MAKYFGQDDAVHPLLAAADLDPTQVAIILSGVTGGALALSELQKLCGTITYLQTALPLISDPEGLYSTQTGVNRGLRLNTGTEILVITLYGEDGNWPV